MRKLTLMLPLFLGLVVFGQNVGLKTVSKPKVSVKITAKADTYVFMYNGHLADVKVSNPTQKTLTVKVKGQMALSVGSEIKKLSTEIKETVAAGETRQLHVFLPLPMEVESHSQDILGKGIRQAIKATVQKEGAGRCEVVVAGKTAETKEWNAKVFPADFFTTIVWPSPGVTDRISTIVTSGKMAAKANMPLNSADDVRCFVGCTAVWMMANEFRNLPPKVQTALADFERLGGTVVVAGEVSDGDGKATEVTVRNVGLGRHVTVPDIRLLQDVAYSFRGSNKASEAKVRTPRAQVAQLRLRGVPLMALPSDETAEIVEPPNFMGYLIGVLATMLLIGPGVFWLMKILKKPLLPLIVTPALAIAGTIIMIIVKLIANGFSSDSDVTGCVWLEPDAGRYCTYGKVRALFRSPFSVKQTFDECCIVTGEGSDLRSTISDGKQQISGVSSSVSSLPVNYDLRSVGTITSSYSLQASFGTDGCTVTNKLGVQLKELVVVGNDGKWYGGVNIKAGETCKLEESGEHGKWENGNLLSEAVSMVIEDTSDKAIWQLVQSGALPVGGFAAVTDTPFLLDFGFHADNLNARTLILGTYGRE